MFFCFWFLLGLFWGSFLGVVLCRLKFQKGKWQLNLAGFSQCDYCQHRLYLKDLIPFFSFLFLKGRCAYCKKPIAKEVFSIEIFTGLIFALSFWQFHFSFDFLFALLIWSILLIIFFYDLKKQVIPDPLVFLLLILFLVKFFLKLEPAFYANFDYKESLLGALILFLFFYLIYYFSQGKFFGLGDAKISIFFGLFLGLKYSFFFLWLSFIFGGFLALILLSLKLKKRKDRIALAPFLIFTFCLLYFFPQMRELLSFLW